MVTPAAPHRSSNNTAASAKYILPNGYLMLIIICQWILVLYLLVENSNSPNSAFSSFASFRSSGATPQLASSVNPYLANDASSLQIDSFGNSEKLSYIGSFNTSVTNPRGVAVAVIFRAPRWFYLRYLIMLHNAFVNLPNENWILQIFVNQDWLDSELKPWHPGMIRFFQHPRVHVTPLPPRLCVGRSKKIVYMDKWFWESMLSDHIILFSGNGAFCGNNKFDWNILQNLDFCGCPNGKPGGDGSTHSYRNRKAMLMTLDYHATGTAVGQAGKVFQGAEDHFFLHYMIDMNQKGLANFRFASVEQTEAFGGVSKFANESGLIRLPIVISGTQPRLTWTERDGLLKHCPELKMIFPSMHEPACFGAKPDPIKCKTSICALQDVIPPSGC